MSKRGEAEARGWARGPPNGFPESLVLGVSAGEDQSAPIHSVLAARLPSPAQSRAFVSQYNVNAPARYRVLYIVQQREGERIFRRWISAKSCFPQTRVALISHARRLKFIFERFRASPPGGASRSGFARGRATSVPFETCVVSRFFASLLSTPNYNRSSATKIPPLLPKDPNAFFRAPV